MLKIRVRTAYVRDRVEPQDPPNSCHFLIPVEMEKNEINEDEEKERREGRNKQSQRNKNK